jgi:hypothetical protein
MCIDSETVSGNYSPDIYGGGATNNPVYVEAGSLFAMPGQGAASLVTNDGAFSGEVRGITVKAVNQNIRVAPDPNNPNQTISLRFMTEAAKPGVSACQEGDSGGPWIQHEGNTSNVLVVGTMEGGSADGSVCYYDQIDAITSFFNVNV